MRKLAKEQTSVLNKKSNIMKKTFFIFALLGLWFSLSSWGCKDTKKTDVFSEEDVPAVAPTQHSDGAGPPPAQATVVTDDNSTTVTNKDEMTSTGYTIGEEERIEWLKVILEKPASSYTKVTANLQDRRQCALFVKKKYTEPLNYLTFWYRYRNSPHADDRLKAKNELAAYYRWRVMAQESEAAAKKWELLMEAIARAKPAYSVDALR